MKWSYVVNDAAEAYFKFITDCDNATKGYLGISLL